MADKSSINRGTAYDILKSLMDLGLVTYYHKETKQYFVAEPPEKLIIALEEKQDNLKRLKDQMQEGLPEIRAIFEKSGNRPAVRFYEGNNGMKQILQDVIDTMKQQTEKIYFVYSSGKVEERKHLYTAMPDFNKKRMAKGIQVRVISLGEKGEVTGLDERKPLKNVVDDKMKMTHEIIYGDKVAHIGLDDSGNSVGVVIDNQSIYTMQKMIFGFNWSQL